MAINLLDLGLLQDGRIVHCVDDGHVVLDVAAVLEQVGVPVGHDDPLPEVREHLLVVADEERVGHVRQLLRVLRRQLERRGLLVRDDVVHEGGAARAGVPQPHCLSEERDKRHIMGALLFRFSLTRNVWLILSVLLS